MGLYIDIGGCVAQNVLFRFATQNINQIFDLEYRKGFLERMNKK